jgi:NAD(P)-dependent dehydrogenase (short-subunit alcohol dehydrogenase family)
MLDGRVAIVTGGGRGIGRQHCLELARHGAAVVVNDPGVGVHGEATGERPADAVVAEIEAAGGRAVTDYGSVADWNAGAALVARAVDDLGRLDVLVNNAGILRDRMITSMVEDDWDAVIAVHLKGTFALTKHASDHWRSVAKGGGTNCARVVNTTSGAGLWGNVGQAAYGAAKAAIVNLTIATALEMGRYDVTANAISPIAATRMTATIGGETAAGSAWDRLDPGNSSPVVAYLASPASGWLTGQLLRVDGNRVQRMRAWTVEADDYVARDGGRLEAEELLVGMRHLYGTLPTGLDTSKSLGT